MPEPNETYAKIQSIRVKNLEQQVHLMRSELQRIREGLLPQKDLFRLTTLSDKLKELNDVLKELRNHYNMEKSKQYQNEYAESMKQMETMADREPAKEDIEQLPSNTRMFAGNPVESTDSFQQKKRCYLNKNNAFVNTTMNEVTDEEKNETFKTCKQLMSDIKSPGSILGNYLVRLQDFRADPELRLQRIERIQKEKEAKLREKIKSKELAESPRENVANLGEEQQSIESIAGKATSSEMNLKESPTSVKSEFEENTSPDASKHTGEGCQCEETFCHYKPAKHIERDSSDLSLDLLLVRQNLKELVYDVVRDLDKDNIALTVVLETDQLYHVSVSKTSSGESLACFFATEEAIQEAKHQNLFKEFLTLFVVNAENSLEQKDRILGHSFEFIKLDV